MTFHKEGCVDRGRGGGSTHARQHTCSRASEILQWVGLEGLGCSLHGR